PGSSIPTSSAASSAPRPSPMTITLRWGAKSGRATPARCGSKARNMWAPTATRCTFASRHDEHDPEKWEPVFGKDHAPRKANSHVAAIADRAEVLVDAEHDEDEFGDDAREHDAGHHPGDAQHGHDEAGNRTIGHQRKRRDHAVKAAQDRHGDAQPVEQLDDRRRDETLPLKQLAGVEHGASLFDGSSHPKPCARGACTL